MGLLIMKSQIFVSFIYVMSDVHSTSARQVTSACGKV